MELDVSAVLTHRFPFDKVLEAYEFHQNATDNAVKLSSTCLDSALDGTGCQTGDVVLDEEGVDEGHWNRSE